jgi:hypothetical protein
VIGGPARTAGIRRARPEHPRGRVGLREASAHRYHHGMTILVFILMVVVISSIVAPLAKGYGERLSKGAPDNREIQRVLTELERAEQRIADTERRLLLAEERLDFQEKLLSTRSAERRGNLPPG